eukprot:412274_1
MVHEFTQMKQFKIQYKEQQVTWTPLNGTSTEEKDWNSNFNSIQHVINSTFQSETKEEFVLQDSDGYDIGNGIELQSLYNKSLSHEIIINLTCNKDIQKTEKQSINNILNALDTDTTDLAGKFKELGDVIGSFQDDKKQAIYNTLKCFLTDGGVVNQFQDILRSMINNESEKYVKCVLQFVAFLGYGIRNSKAGIVLDSKPNKEMIQEIKSNFHHLLNSIYNSENNMVKKIYESIAECFIFKEKEVEDCNTNELIDAIDDICNESDILNTYNEIFKTWFKRNDIDGIKFVKYARKNFAEEIIAANNEIQENKKLRGPSIQLFKKLHQYDFNYISKSNEIGLSMDQRQNWICYNCGNKNVNNFTANKITTKIETCILCGIQRTESIVIKLRNNPTFITVNDFNDDNETEHKMDDIDSIIQNAAKHNSFNLICPNKNDNECCPSILRLSKTLITYKRWLATVSKKTKGNDNIEKTIQVDIPKYVSNDEFKAIFIEKTKSMQKLNETQIELLITMIENNVHDLNNVKTFSKMKRKDFINFIKQQTQIKPAFVGKLYNKINKSLKDKAQRIEFGNFLSNMNTANNDYYHILKVHINEGNKSSITNAFRFFGRVVHFEDSSSDVADCRSVKRKANRLDKLKFNNDTEMIKNTIDENNIWKLQQYYIQSQLDTIHSHLAHSKLEPYVQRYSEKFSNKEIGREHV